MFWTDWGEFPKIERAGMNGEARSRKTIVVDDIIWPNGLAVDHQTKHIYWSDGKLLRIERTDYDGAERLKIKDGLKYPYALTKIDTNLFWTDWNVP